MLLGFTAIFGDPKFGVIHFGLSHCIAFPAYTWLNLVINCCTNEVCSCSNNNVSRAFWQQKVFHYNRLSWWEWFLNGKFIWIDILCLCSFAYYTDKWMDNDTFNTCCEQRFQFWTQLSFSVNGSPCQTCQNCVGANILKNAAKNYL